MLYCRHLRKAKAPVIMAWRLDQALLRAMLCRGTVVARLYRYYVPPFKVCQMARLSYSAPRALYRANRLTGGILHWQPSIVEEKNNV
jgi:hypothetical protein